MFLNVILHAISSPAKTVCSFHSTKARMLEEAADIVLFEGAEVKLCFDPWEGKLAWKSATAINYMALLGSWLHRKTF